MTEHARITVTLLEPVAAGKQLRTDFVHDTYDHLPGTVLRGALASRHLNESEQPPEVLSTSDEFLDVFEGDGSFGPLHNEHSLPLPLSVQRHKYAPGARCTTTWRDGAKGNSETPNCPTCQQDLEFSKGEPTGTIQRIRRTRAALDEHGVAQDGQLFTQNSLRAGTRLSGWLYGPALRALHIGDEPIDTLYLGGRTKHQGTAQVQVDTAAEPDLVEQDGTRLILRLLGPGVFVDEHGFPSQYPDLAELSEELGVDALHVESSWVRWCEIEGWHAASGLPKPTERAVHPGSTYVIRCAREPNPQARKRLMARGIGLRRREGFGALYSGQRSVDPHEIANSLAPMRIAEDQATYLPLLRARAERMPHEPVDDQPFRARMNTDDAYGRSLAKLLAITDPVLFRTVLESLEASS